jgi:hypothetical protein
LYGEDEECRERETYKRYNILYKTTTLSSFAFFRPPLQKDTWLKSSSDVEWEFISLPYELSCFISCKFHQSPQAIFNNAPSLGSQDDGIHKSNVFAYNLTMWFSSSSSNIFSINKICVSTMADLVVWSFKTN